MIVTCTRRCWFITSHSKIFWWKILVHHKPQWLKSSPEWLFRYKDSRQYVTRLETLPGGWKNWAKAGHIFINIKYWWGFQKWKHMQEKFFFLADASLVTKNCSFYIFHQAAPLRLQTYSTMETWPAKWYHAKQHTPNKTTHNSGHNFNIAAFHFVKNQQACMLERLSGHRNCSPRNGTIINSFPGHLLKMPFQSPSRWEGPLPGKSHISFSPDNWRDEK